MKSTKTNAALLALALYAAVASGQARGPASSPPTATAPVAVSAAGVVSMPAAGAGQSGYLMNAGGEFTVDAGFNVIGNVTIPAASRFKAQGGLTWGYSSANAAWTTAPGDGVPAHDILCRALTLYGTSNALVVANDGAKVYAGASAYCTATGQVNTCTYQMNAQGGIATDFTDQSADCDNAATGNAHSGKICVQAGQGSMTFTNSKITSSSIILLTNVSDDTTCLSGYATAGTGTATIGCVGAATATANTVMSFLLVN